MPKRSAGLLLYRLSDDGASVLLVHPGGPFWAKKDLGAWSIPKGEYAAGEDPLAVARREFEEETGAAPAGEFTNEYVRLVTDVLVSVAELVTTSCVNSAIVRLG